MNIQRYKPRTRYRGLSTDEKPQNAEHGSTFHEMDTGTVYYYDKAGGEWYEAPGDDRYVVKTVSGNPITVSDALDARIKSLIASHATAQPGTPAPDNPADIVCNNGTLKWDTVNHRVYADGTPNVISVYGKNLVNVATNVKGNYISASGVISSDTGSTPNSQYTDLIPVNVGEKYTWSMISNRPKAGNDRCHGYNANGVWVQQIDFAEGGAGGVEFSLTVTIPSGVSYLRLSYGINDTDAMLEKGAAKTDYEAYSGQTATVENLYTVGDYTDEQEIISGKVTRKCGVRVLDGTEEWVTDTYGGSRRFVNYNFAKQELSTVLCTHFSSTADDGARTSPGNAYVAATGALVIYKAASQTIDTVEGWKSFLYAQYAAGTPVIVLYPLAEESVEHVTAQPLSAYIGTTTVNANNGTTITMTYKAEKGE